MVPNWGQPCPWRGPWQRLDTLLVITAHGRRYGQSPAGRGQGCCPRPASPRQPPTGAVLPPASALLGSGESSADSTASTAFSSLIQDTEGNQAPGFSDGGGCLQKSSVSTLYEPQCRNRIGCPLVSGQKLVLGTYVRGGSGELDVVGTELGPEHAVWALALHAPAACRWECHCPRVEISTLSSFLALTAFIL